MKIALPSYSKVVAALETELVRLQRLSHLSGIENKAEVDQEIGLLQRTIRLFQGKGHSGPGGQQP